MMNHYKVSVSVIIPCYNASKYLMALTDCLIRQDFDDYEAIFINDGDSSQDGILEEIVEMDSRFKAFRKDNGGVSSARNLGLEKAEGEWIVFVDPDDTVKPYFLSSLYKAVKETNADFGIGSFLIFNGKEEIPHVLEDGILHNKNIDFVEYFNYIEKDVHHKACWAKIFRKEIIDNNAIRFDTRFSMGEDWTFVLMYYKHTNHVAIVENCGYCYNCSSTNGLSSKYDSTHMQFTLESIELLSFLRQRIGRPDAQIKADGDKDYTNLCFSFLKNLYCTKGHPSLCESIQLIKNQLLSNEVLLTALRSVTVQKKSDKIQKMLIMTGNATIIAIAHKILYGLWHRKMVKKHRKIIYSGIIVMLMLLLYFLVILFLPMNGDNIDLGNNRYYIAHGGGAISGKEYTNSREALDNSLNMGYKYIEIDLRETSDSAIVCCHEWEDFYHMTGIEADADKGITLQKFKQCKIYGKYSTLVADDLLKKLEERKDFVLVTDKLSDAKKLNKVFPYVQRHRIMVEAFRSQDYAELKDAGYIPMMSVATLKDMLVFEMEVLLKTGNVIERVTMPIRNEYVYRLFKRIFGVKIAVYTSNDENFFKRYLGKEIDMVYTDSCSLIKK